MDSERTNGDGPRRGKGSRGGRSVVLSCIVIRPCVFGGGKIFAGGVSRRGCRPERAVARQIARRESEGRVSSVQGAERRRVLRDADTRLWRGEEVLVVMSCRWLGGTSSGRNCHEWNPPLEEAASCRGPRINAPIPQETFGLQRSLMRGWGNLGASAYLLPFCSATTMDAARQLHSACKQGPFSCIAFRGVLPVRGVAARI
jgi:hypothetical protein